MNVDIFMCISDNLELSDISKFARLDKSHAAIYYHCKRKIFVNELNKRQIEYLEVDPEVVLKCLLKRGVLSYFDEDLLGFDLLIVNGATDLVVGFYIALARQDKWTLELLMDSVEVHIVGNAISCCTSNEPIRKMLIENYKTRSDLIKWL